MNLCFALISVFFSLGTSGICLAEDAPSLYLDPQIETAIRAAKSEYTVAVFKRIQARAEPKIVVLVGRIGYETPLTSHVIAYVSDKALPQVPLSSKKVSMKGFQKIYSMLKTGVVKAKQVVEAIDEFPLSPLILSVAQNWAFDKVLGPMAIRTFCHGSPSCIQRVKRVIIGVDALNFTRGLLKTTRKTLEPTYGDKPLFQKVFFLAHRSNRRQAQATVSSLSKVWKDSPNLRAVGLVLTKTQYPLVKAALSSHKDYEELPLPDFLP